MDKAKLRIQIVRFAICMEGKYEAGPLTFSSVGMWGSGMLNSLEIGQ